MPGITFDGSTKKGILLYYIAEDQELYLTFVASQAPESYTIFKASDPNGNFETAWSVTELGWNSLKAAVRSAVEEYEIGSVTYAGESGTSMQYIENYKVAFDPD